MSDEPQGPRPAVYARLAEEAEVRLVRRAAHPLAHLVGWAIVGGIVVAVVIAVLWTG